MAQPWSAPVATMPVDAEVRVPGSKSMTNRALVLGSVAAGRSTLRAPLRSRDTTLMVAALRSLGAGIDDSDDGTWTVDGGRVAAGPLTVDVGNAGTVLRFVPPLAARSPGPVGFDGDAAARRRPVAPLLGALRDLGVEVDDGGRGGLPFVVRGRGGLAGGPVSLDASGSSQLVSALLLAAPAYDGGIVVHHVGERPVPNAPHLAMTTAMLRARGVAVIAELATWSVAAGPVAAVDEAIEPDLSSAAPFLAAAVVTGGRVRVPDWPAASTQPGALLPSLLEQFGAVATAGPDGLVVAGGGRVTGADVDLRDAGELTPVLAAVAALADSPSRLVGVDYLRGHETDRLAALARELSALGATVIELPDGLSIRPGRMRPGVFATYDDHRLAMAGAVVGLVVPGVSLDDVATTAKTLPDFARMWTSMLGGHPAAALGVGH
jgi:3-phosphoshikimate 1-carboxyvinyltransferase